MENNESNKQSILPISFTDEYCGNNYCLEILRLFGTHPETRFNRLAVIHMISKGGGKPEVERALEHLADKGVVKSCIESNTQLYSLTNCETIRRQVLTLGKLGWRQWQLLLEQHYLPSRRSSSYRTS